MNTWLSSSEAAAYLGVSVPTIRRWCLAGKLPHWQTPGGQRRFAKHELKAWVEEQQKPIGAER